MSTLAVTGHRPDKLGGYTNDVLQRLVYLAEYSLKAENPQVVITGMALGWDQAIAEACRKLSVPFIAAVPFLGQEMKWPRESQAYYRELLSHAMRIEYVCEPGYQPWKMQKRNEWMVLHCDRLLALWNGTEGGTANCVNFATQQGITVANVWQHWQEHKS